jgi:threonine dehydratase
MTDAPLPVSLDDIRAAARVIEGQLVRTPTVEAAALSRLTGAVIWAKLESQQVTGSFKPRGALVRMKQLTPAQAKAGVVAQSAGNHAQGVAYHAGRLGIPATIVMPKGTPFTKVERTRALGARVVLHGDNLTDSFDHALALAARDGLTFVHPYDDPHVIAGQGTIGLEMLAEAPDLDCLVVPIGGGGLIAGIAIAAKALKPAIEIVGVQAELYPSMYQAIHGLAPSSGGQTIAEGIAVKSPGRLNQAIIARLVDDIMLVGESVIERAIQVLLEEQKLVAEGAGAAGLAAILDRPDRFRGRRVGFVLCGGNIDVRMLASVAMRGLVRDGRLVRLRVEISDSPGTLARVAGLIGECGGNIIEIYHHRLFQDVPVKLAELDAVIETRNADHVREITQRLGAAGFRARVLGTTNLGGETI